MSDTENRNPPSPLLLQRSKTEGRISLSGNGIGGFSTDADGGVVENGGRLLQRSRTELFTPGSACSSQGSCSSKDFDVDRVLYEISRKVNANKKALLYLFRNNDPSGRGAISRDALHRIMRVLYGFLSSDQFQKILRRINIHNRSQITYEVFMACFEDAEAMQKRYLRKSLMEPFWRAASSESHQEPVELIDSRDERKFNEVATGAERSKSADDRVGLLKRRVLEVFPQIRENFDAAEKQQRDLLLTSKMLRTVLEKAGIHVTVEDANAFWDRLDTARCGLVPLRRFYTFIDPLSENLFKPGSQAATSSSKVSTLLPAPSKSQMMPRMAIGASKAANPQVARSFNHYKYPPASQDPDTVGQQQQQQQQPEQPNQSSENKQSKFPHVPPSYLSKSMVATPGSRKRPLVLENDKPVLVQLVNRLVEPREQFMAFCRRFDDDLVGGSGRIALGQLLGCLLFCGKVVPEPLVQQLVGKMGVKTAPPVCDDCQQQQQCSPPAARYDYKALGCSMFDADANRLLAAVIQNPEHYFRLMRSEVFAEWCDSEPTNYEALETKFLKFMYNDIIRLVTELRRLDRNNSGVVPEKDFESAMARIFNTSFTRKQLLELTRGCQVDESQSHGGTSGGIQIAEFVKSMFATAQPDICRILSLSSSSTNKQRHLGKNSAPPVHAPADSSAPVAQLPDPQAVMEAEIAKTHAETPLTTTTTAQPVVGFGVATEMSEDEAVDLFKQIMKDRFHTFDKQFIALDVKQTKRISQFQLHQILRNMNIHLNMRELAYMWKYVPTDADGLCSYRRFLLHFISNGHGGPLQGAVAKKQPSMDVTLPKAPESAPAGDQQNRPEKVISSSTPAELDQVLECIRADVCRQWGVLKERIRQEDASGSGSFDADRLDYVIKGSGIDVTTESLGHLSRKYTQIVRNRRRFFYMPFMRYFTKRFSSNPSA